MCIWVGDRRIAAKGEIPFDVTTDKLTNEVEAKESGILREMLVKEGETVKCLNVGCIPTKVLLHSAEVFTDIKNSTDSIGDHRKAS